MSIQFSSKLICVLFSVCGLALACSIAKTEPPNSNFEITTSTPPTNDSSQQLLKTSIRSIDFAQVAYPRFRLANGNKALLKPGEAVPAHVNYGDVTGDDAEEAMVVLGVKTHGTAVPHHVYIFALEENNPKLLWDFETCDRADGGLRQVYSENRELVIELYGRDKILGTNLCADDGTRRDQPYRYAVTRSRFIWSNGKFLQREQAEVFYDPEGYGSPIMPLYPGKQ